MDRCLKISWSLAERLDQPMLHWQATMMRAMRALLAGDHDEAEAKATETLRIGTDGGEPDASGIYGAQLGAVMSQRGTFGESLPVIEQLSAELPLQHAAINGVLALVYAEVGRLDDARELLTQFAAADFELPADPGSWLLTMTSYAKATVTCRDTNIGAALFDRLAPFADQVPTNILNASDPISYILGSLATILGRYDQAEVYFASAAEFNERAGAKFFAANTNLAWGKMLAERAAPGDVERARHLLSMARTAAVAYGYAGTEQHAAEALDHLSSR